MAALASITLLMLDGDGNPDPVTLGDVSAAEPGSTVRTGAASRPLEAGEAIVAGDVVQAPSTGSVTVDLEGGGVVRFDTGASVTFTDEAIDAETGERDGASEPTLQVLAGRAWVNPADGTTVEVRLPGGRATTVANPVAIECPGDCTLHAPAAGVDIDSDGGADAAPIPTELVTLRADGTMTLGVGRGRDRPGRARTSTPTGAPACPTPSRATSPASWRRRCSTASIRSTSTSRGLPRETRCPRRCCTGAGESYELELAADGSACPPTSCELPVSAADGATGTAEVGGGTVTVTFTQPINCYDESRDNVVVAAIGTTTVTATLTVGDVAQDGPRWRIGTSSGSGTVSTTLTTPCNPGDVLGTSSSPTSITVG